MTENGAIGEIPSILEDLLFPTHTEFKALIPPSYWDPAGGLIRLEEGHPIESMSHPYDLPSTAICEKSGMMYLHQEEKKNLKKYYCV